MAEVKRRQLSINEALGECEFGLGQKLQTLLCALAWGVASFQTFIVLFSSLGGFDAQKSRLIECLKQGPEGEPCEAALSEHSNAFCALPRDSWAFKSRGYSLVTEFDLACGKSVWLVYAAAGCFFLGTLAGCALWHVFSDRLPPRRILNVSAIIAGVAGCLAATAPFLWTFMLFRLFSGLGVAGIGIAAFVLASDLTGPSWRPYTGLFLQGGFSMGAATATLVAFAIPSWRWITLLSALLPLAMTAFTWSLLVESPQWLLLHGRKGEATAALAAIAFTNKTRPPEYPLADPSGLLANPHRFILDIFRSVRLRRLSVLLCLIWCTLTCAYYSSAMLSDALSSGNPDGDGTALHLALTGFMYELPGVAAAGLIAERLGRKYALIGGLLQSGGCLLAAALAHGDMQRALAVGARFGLGAACAALYILTWEIFPCVVQHPGMALITYAARIGAVAAPALVFAAAKLHSSLVPLAVIGATLLAAAALATVLPETLNAQVYETIQELNSAAVKRHRSWTNSLRNVFRPLPGSASPTPSGAISISMPSLPLDPAGRSV